MPGTTNANPAVGRPPPATVDGERKPAARAWSRRSRRPGGPDVPPGLDQALNRLRNLFAPWRRVPPARSRVRRGGFRLWALTGVYIAAQRRGV